MFERPVESLPERRGEGHEARQEDIPSDPQDVPVRSGTGTARGGEILEDRKEGDGAEKKANDPAPDQRPAFPSRVPETNENQHARGGDSIRPTGCEHASEAEDPRIPAAPPTDVSMQ